LLHVATCLWDPNKHSLPGSLCYTEEWVDKLYRGFKRNLSLRFRFVLFTDRIRKFHLPIEQELLSLKEPDYGSFTEPYRLNEPMILVGLDTVIVGNIDHFWNYCFTADKIALCRDPYQLERSINGIALVPAGFRWLWDTWEGENDMEWLRQHADHTAFIDDIWPGHCLSLKAHDVRGKGLQGARVIYFHGKPKMHLLGHLGWIREHWS
jgi:hypothetical protein